MENMDISEKILFIKKLSMIYNTIEYINYERNKSEK